MSARGRTGSRDSGPGDRSGCTHSPSATHQSVLHGPDARSMAQASPRSRALFTTCGADTSSCAIVVKKPYARLFGGAPNVYVGIIWNVALLGLALRWMVTGGLVVPWPYLLVAVVSVLVGGYLVRALVVDLRQPCPL